MPAPDDRECAEDQSDLTRDHSDTANASSEPHSKPQYKIGCDYYWRAQKMRGGQAYYVMSELRGRGGGGLCCAPLRAFACVCVRLQARDARSQYKM